MDFVAKAFLWILIVVGAIGNTILAVRAYFLRYVGELFLDEKGKFHRITDVKLSWNSNTYVQIYHNHGKYTLVKLSEFYDKTKVMTEAHARKHYPHKLI